MFIMSLATDGVDTNGAASAMREAATFAIVCIAAYNAPSESDVWFAAIETASNWIASSGPPWNANIPGVVKPMPSEGSC